MCQRATKMTRLYDLITSECYTGKLAEAHKLTQDILELEVQEKTAHDGIWKRRGSLVKRVSNVLREAETEVAAVIEGQEGGGLSPSPAKRTAMQAANSRAKETIAWNSN